MMDDHGQSDRPVVPTKSPNKAGASVAEGMEGRGLAKGNSGQQNAPRTLSRDGARSALARVREAAERDKTVQFTALLHHIYIKTAPRAPPPRDPGAAPLLIEPQPSNGRRAIPDGAAQDPAGHVS